MSAAPPGFAIVGRAADPLNKENWDDDFDLGDLDIAAGADHALKKPVHADTPVLPKQGSALLRLQDDDVDDWDNEDSEGDSLRSPRAQSRLTTGNNRYISSTLQPKRGMGTGLGIQTGVADDMFPVRNASRRSGLFGDLRRQWAEAHTSPNASSGALSPNGSREVR